MQTVEVRGSVRTAAGKTGARTLRAAGRLPAVLYGSGEGSLSICLDSKEFEGVLREHGSGAFIIDLKIEGHEDRDLTALIKEIQRHPVTWKPLHVDFQHVSMTQMVTVNIPVHLFGTAIGVKEGGLLEHLCREVEIQCQASMIPEDFKLDVSDLVKGHSLHVSDLQIPDGVTMITPADRVLATIVVKAVEVAPVAAPEAAEAAAASEEEEKKGKAAEDTSAKS